MLEVPLAGPKQQVLTTIQQLIKLLHILDFKADTSEYFNIYALLSSTDIFFLFR